MLGCMTVLSLSTKASILNLVLKISCTVVAVWRGMNDGVGTERSKHSEFDAANKCASMYIH